MILRIYHLDKMGIELYSHQLSAIDRLHTGSILCGGVGSGKSRTAIAYYFLKVCGGQMQINGEGEYKEMVNPKKLFIITTARKRDTQEWEKEYLPFMLSDVVIDSWNNIKKYIDIKDSFFIFDEQRVVGYGAWSKSFIKIAKQNKWILLTATPGDTWLDYIPVFIANGFYENKTDFIRQHVIYSRYTKFPKVDRYLNTGKLIRLKNEIMVNMKYTKPTCSHNELIFCAYDPIVYNHIWKDRWDVYKDQPLTDISSMCYAARRCANSDPSRLAKVRDLIIEHPKSIIFYNFNYELELLRSLGESMGITVREWNGHKHEPIPDANRWVYLVNYAAGAEGWNCTETDTIIFYSQNYSYKTMVQAAGRIDRLNTPFTDLYYYHLRSRAPIDLGIAKALNKKQKFNENTYFSKK